MSLFELVDGDAYKFDIPDYQRPYSWRSKQVRGDHGYSIKLRTLHAHMRRSLPFSLQVYELLKDLLGAYKAGQEYFLGAIVATRPESSSTGAPYQVRM